MTRADIVEAIHKSGKVDLSKRQISQLVNATFDIISDYLSEPEENKKVMISGFGAFIIKKRKSKIGRNPKTKEEKVIPERYGLSFKAGKNLKEALKKVKS